MDQPMHDELFDSKLPGDKLTGDEIDYIAGYRAGEKAGERWNLVFYVIGLMCGVIATLFWLWGGLLG